MKNLQVDLDFWKRYCLILRDLKEVQVTSLITVDTMAGQTLRDSDRQGDRKSVRVRINDEES